jgi:AraC-like DNA-binding protein
MEDIYLINSIGELHNILGYEKPKHPLISLIDASKTDSLRKYQNRKFMSGFYTIALKNYSDCMTKYGRETFDFSEGSLVFTAPKLVGSISYSTEYVKTDGWILCFHPDLFVGTDLAAKMEEYTYFHYLEREALHLSDDEKETITSIVNTIQKEYSMNLDVYSQKLLVSNLEVLLNYCERFYGRQFITRRKANVEAVVLFEKLLQEKMEQTSLERNGLPTVKELSEELGYSTYYLSTLLKNETGLGTKEHIYDKLISRAKNLLAGTNDSIADIAYQLGYEHPEHFSKFFKVRVGVSPNNYRKSF